MQAQESRTGEVLTHQVVPHPVMSIIIPTFNEASNLPELFGRLLQLVQASKLSIETIVVDDSSPDGTGLLAEELAFKNNGTLSARVLHRPAKLGLSSAVLDGVRASRAPWVAMVDADNSHDIAKLAEMYEHTRDGADVVVGSRYVNGGRIEAWPATRRVISLGATTIARALFRLKVRDPMSGFALMRRETALLLGELYNPRAYKFLLEVLVRLRPNSVVEVPFTFRNRRNGQSKLGWRQIAEYCRLILVLLEDPRVRG